MMAKPMHRYLAARVFGVEYAAFHREAHRDGLTVSDLLRALIVDFLVERGHDLRRGRQKADTEGREDSKAHGAAA